MKNLKKVLSTILIIIASIFVLLAYFVTTQDPYTGIYFDGLGRELSATPTFVRLFFGQERLWAGAFWALADIAIVFSVGIAIYLFNSDE